MSKEIFGSDGSKMVEIKFKFKIDTKVYAKRFGIEITSDDMDTILTGDPNHNEADAHDESVAMDAATFSFIDNQVKTDLAHCKAQNPMTCRFHGVQALANDVDSFLKAQGVNGQVNVEIISVDTDNGKQVITAEASVIAPESDEDKVKKALKAFYKLDGVEGTVGDDLGYDDTTNKFAEIFDVDMLDPNAAARWKFGQNEASAAATEDPKEEEPKKQKGKGKRTRKQTRKGMISPDEDDTQKPVEEPVQEDIPQQEDDDFDPNAPTLFPGEKPKEPPKWDPVFTQAELASLKKVSDRLAKTVRQINKHIDDGTTATWLQNTKHGNPLPGSLMKYQNEVDLNALQTLASKDTNGSVKKLIDVANQIEASKSNGWMDKVMDDKWDANAPFFLDPSKTGNVDFTDIAFDSSKYDDPYAKERAEYNAFVPSSVGRDKVINVVKEIDASNDKNAPKDAAREARDANDAMKELEDAYAELEDMIKDFDGSIDPFADVRTKLGQAYYKENEKFKSAIDACNDWSSKQRIAQDSISGVIEAYERRGLEVPQELVGMQAVEDEVKERGWQAVAQYHGLDVNDKALLDNFKKNIKAYFQKCPTCSSYDIDDIYDQIVKNTTEYTKGNKHYNGTRTPGKQCKNNGRFHASNNSYIHTMNGVFGMREKAHTKSSKLQMHAYGTVCAGPFCDVGSSMMYKGSDNCCTILTNPKQSAIAFFGQYYGTANYFRYNGQQDPKNRNYTGSYVNNANASMFANSPNAVSADAFKKDLSSMNGSDLQKALGFHHQTGEAWIIGGIPKSGILAIKEQKSRGQIDANRVSEFNALGITVMDKNGKIVGKDCVPDDPDLVKLVWGEKGRPSK